MNNETKSNDETKTTNDVNLFQVDAVLKIEVRKGLFHYVRYPNLDDLKKLEYQHPDKTAVDKRGEIDTDINIDIEIARKKTLWSLITDKIEGYPFSDLNQVPVTHKIPVVNEVLRVGAENEAYILNHFGPDYVKEAGYDNIVVYIVADQAETEIPCGFRFSEPTEKQFTRYSKAAAFTQKIKKGEFTLSSRPKADLMCSLFTELCQDAWGYSDTNLVTIPALHQIVALDSLFKGLNEVLGKQEKN